MMFKTRPSTIPTGIWVLGFVSLLMDVSSEMIHSLLPLFLITTLGASALMIGLIEGMLNVWSLSVRRRENDPPDHFLTLLHLEFACSFNDDPVLTHQPSNTPMPHTDDLLQTEVGLKVRLGDPEKFGEQAAIRLQSLHNTVKVVTARVIALANDQTRTEVAKHHAAKLLAEKATKAIGETVKDFSVRSKLLQREGAKQAENAFAPREGYAHIESGVRGWVREQMKSPEGMATVSGMMKSDAAFAAIVCHSPHYLVGVAKEVHSNWYVDAVERYVPEAFAALNESNELLSIVTRAEATARDIGTAFFNPALAAQAGTRVEIE